MYNETFWEFLQNEEDQLKKDINDIKSSINAIAKTENENNKKLMDLVIKLAERVLEVSDRLSYNEATNQEVNDEKVKIDHEQLSKHLGDYHPICNEDSITIANMARMLNRDLGFETGRARFFQWLVDIGALQRHKNYYVVSLKYINSGYFVIRKYRPPFITGKGKQWLLKLYSETHQGIKN